MSNKLSRLSAGKYRDIIIAASLFVVFDMAVLVLNFYTSFQIAEDATSINLSGRQRMLSQRMTKSLLEAHTEDAEVRKQAADELAGAFELFDTTLDAFTLGGIASNTDGNKTLISVTNDSEVNEVLMAAGVIWQPIKLEITRFLANTDDTGALVLATQLASQKNVELLKLMNQLTTRLAVLAQDKAQRLRMFQVIGISLALINFIILLFHFIKKLRRGDEAVVAAEQETREILGTVNEGFFLLDENLNLGQKYSEALPDIMKRDIAPGMPFLSLLEGKVTGSTLDTAREYISLLFTKRIRENLAADLNPLVRLEMDLSNRSGVQDIHYLNITFKRVQSDDRITHLLGTVVDVTEQIALEASLAAAEKRSEEELQMLSKILQSNPVQMKQYLDETRTLILSINNRFERSKSISDMHQIISTTLPEVHRAKGDASASGNDIFVTMLHDLEQLMKTISSNTEASTRDLLPVTIQLNEILAKMAAISSIIDKIANLAPAMSSSMDEMLAQRWLQDFNRLAATVSEDTGKMAEVSLEQDCLDRIDDDDARSLREICIQMIRNAIVHGIEVPEQRRQAGKNETGHISVALSCTADNSSLIIRDDGQGLSVKAIRDSLLKSGKYTSEQLEAMDDKAIVMSIFTNGLSTSTDVTNHAGQGVGLTVVTNAVKRLSGRLNVSSNCGKFTEFRMTFSGIRIKPENELYEQSEVLIA